MLRLSWAEEVLDVSRKENDLYLPPWVFAESSVMVDINPHDDCPNPECRFRRYTGPDGSAFLINDDGLWLGYSQAEVMESPRLLFQSVMSCQN